jgi:hypothetical protein
MVTCHDVTIGTLDETQRVGLFLGVPTVVVNYRGFKITVNVLEDGEGPHAHVYKAGVEYRVRLLADDAKIMTVDGKATKAQIRAAVKAVALHLPECWEEWNRWHKRK